jgi:AraC-like DNA-binding protein
MPNTIIYDDFSMLGLSKAFCEYFNVTLVNNGAKLDNEIGKMNLQSLKLPGEIDVLFFEYEYKQDFCYEHTVEKEQHFALWIDCCQTTLQQITINNQYIEKMGPQQNYAYLMSTIFPYTQCRTKGSKGKSLIIFIPNFYLEKYLQSDNQESLLAKFYSLQNSRDSFLQLEEEQVKKLESLFYQWNEYKNIFSITKYSFQFIEWYFAKLSNSLGKLHNEQKLSPNQAVDLFLLQKHINDSLSLAEINLENLHDFIKTPLTALKKLFEQVHHKSIHAYFKESKIVNAKKLLTHTNKNISDIAYEFGYANPSNFSASFKRYFSITPQEYRKQLLAK